MKKTLIIFLSLFVVLTSCKIQEPIINSPTDFSITSINQKDKSIKISLTVPIENPNNTSFNLKGAELDLLVNKRNIGNIKKIEKVKILANSKQAYPITFEITLKDLETSILRLISEFQTKSTDLNIKGDITFSKFLLKYKVKIDEHKIF